MNAEKDEDYLKEEEIEPEKRKPWENILLIAVLCLTLFILSAGWNELSILNRSMYATLAVALCLMYGQRKWTLTAKKLLLLNRLIFIFVGISLLLFAIGMYYEYFA